MINSAIPIASPRTRSKPMGIASAQPILRASFGRTGRCRTARRKLTRASAERRQHELKLRSSGRGGGERGRRIQFAIPGEENLDTRESLRRWKIKHQNCYKGFGSFG